MTTPLLLYDNCLSATIDAGHKRPSPCKHLRIRNADRRSLLVDSDGGDGVSVVQNKSSSSYASPVCAAGCGSGIESSSGLLATVAQISSSSSTARMSVSPAGPLFLANVERNSVTIGALDREPGDSFRGRYST